MFKVGRSMPLSILAGGLGLTAAFDVYDGTKSGASVSQIALTVSADLAASTALTAAAAALPEEAGAVGIVGLAVASWYGSKQVGSASSALYSYLNPPMDPVTFSVPIYGEDPNQIPSTSYNMYQYTISPPSDVPPGYENAKRIDALQFQADPSHTDSETDQVI